jgi:protein-S-isoprenylcysteine O-methyltransferase Ste14
MALSRSTGDAAPLVVRLGGWLFKHRTWLPLPLVLTLLLIPSDPGASGRVWLGVALVGAGELLRLWGVRQIGVISRTRSDRLGPLVDTGPFAYVRNPLYLGNILLWAGFASAARIPWAAPLLVLLLALEYHAIVRWEERLLASRLGPAYEGYLSRVPRWMPWPAVRSGQHAVVDAATTRHGSGSAAAPFSWSETFFSERGTLIAIVAGFVLLWLKE